MNPVEIVILVVALAALGVAVYVATRPAPVAPAASSGGLDGIAGTVLHLIGV